MSLNNVAENAIAQLETKVKRLEALRKEERNGRTRAEQRLRTLLLEKSFGAHGGFVLPPIGCVKTSFHDRRGTSRQSFISDAALATITFHPDIQSVFSSITEGLREFSHVWVISYFHLNTNAVAQWPSAKLQKTSANAVPSKADSDSILDLVPLGTFKKVKAKLLPPRKLDHIPIGVFGCRSPHRPNPLGLSVAQLVKIDENRREIIVRGLDLVDGTPVLDLKPYISSCDVAPNAFVPPWVVASYAKDKSNVEVPDTVVSRLTAHAIENGNWLYPYSSVQHLLTALQQVLSVDIRSRHQVTTAHAAEESSKMYLLHFHGFQFKYTIDTDLSSRSKDPLCAQTQMQPPFNRASDVHHSNVRVVEATPLSAKRPSGNPLNIPLTPEEEPLA